MINLDRDIGCPNNMNKDLEDGVFGISFFICKGTNDKISEEKQIRNENKSKGYDACKMKQVYCDSLAHKIVKYPLQKL